MSVVVKASSRARRLQAQRSDERAIAEMVGLVQGIVADGRVSAEEAERLAAWTRNHPETALRWPANILALHLTRIFEDGRVDRRERARLRAMLEQLAANPAGFAGGFRLATDLPIPRPEPPVVFEGRTFLFAGEMAYGPVHACEREVQELGGSCLKTVTRRLDYVVIGAIAAQDWAQRAFGAVVDDVVRYRARGVSIAVITEEHWAAALP